MAITVKLLWRLPLLCTQPNGLVLGPSWLWRVVLLTVTGCTVYFVCRRHDDIVAQKLAQEREQREAEKVDVGIPAGRKRWCCSFPRMRIGPSKWTAIVHPASHRRQKWKGAGYIMRYCNKKRWHRGSLLLNPATFLFNAFPFSVLPVARTCLLTTGRSRHEQCSEFGG